jgi:hypothetical protein
MNPARPAPPAFQQTSAAEPLRKTLRKKYASGYPMRTRGLGERQPINP